MRGAPKDLPDRAAALLRVPLNAIVIRFSYFLLNKLPITLHSQGPTNHMRLRMAPVITGYLKLAMLSILGTKIMNGTNIKIVDIARGVSMNSVIRSGNVRPVCLL